MSGPNEPKRPGRSSNPGQEPELDFESDALLDSLLFDELPGPTPLPTNPTPIKLHQPSKREFSEDDVTVVGRTEDLLAKLTHEEDDGTSGLEDLANSDIDQLLSSLPAPPAVETNPPPTVSIPRLPDVPPAPRVPGVPRRASRLPGSLVPRSGRGATTKPPSVNPAGPPARQPFPLAVSPQAPQVAPVARQTLDRTIPERGSANQDDDERTRVFTQEQALNAVEPGSADRLSAPFLD